MKKLSIKHLVMIVAISFCAKSSFAADGLGVFVEPGITYESGSTQINYPSPFSDSTGSVNGLGVLARLGIHLGNVVFVAADGRYSQPRFKDSTNDLDAAATAYNYGLTAGIQMPTLIGLRIWGSYIADGQLNPDMSNNVDFKFTGANGYRVGAGIKVAFASINVEYEHIRYNTTTVEQLGPFQANANFDDSKLTDNAWIASVSFPIAL